MDGNIYYPTPCTTGLWEHRTLARNFCFCVNDFGVKYFSKDEEDHLLDARQKNYAEYNEL